MKKTSILLLVALSILMLSCRRQIISNDFCGCANTPTFRTIGTDTFIVHNIFTPNGDGYNDIWMVQGWGSHPTLIKKIYRLGIFNTLIYQGTNTNSGWDGKYNGSPVPDGKYEYKLSMGSAVITGYVCKYTAANSFVYNCLSGCSPEEVGDPILH